MIAPPRPSPFERYGLRGPARADPAGSTYHAALWNGTAAMDLTPHLPRSDTSVGYAVNAADHVAGALTAGGIPRAFVWAAGVVTLLPVLTGAGAFGFGLNDAGQVVGAAYSPELTPLGQMAHAVTWQDGAISDLGLLPGDEDSSAVAVNSTGQIVGSSGRSDPDTYESQYRVTRPTKASPAASSYDG